MAASDIKTVVIDNGSGMMKVGFAGDDESTVSRRLSVGEKRRYSLSLSFSLSLSLSLSLSGPW